MKKRLLKLSSLFIAIAIIFSFTACKPEPPDGGDETKTPADTSVETPTDFVDSKWMDVPGANGDSNLRLPKFDITNNMVTIMCHFEITQPDVARENAARDIYGIQHQTTLVAAEDRMVKFMSAYMADEAPDIFIYAFTPSLVTKGYCDDWGKYIDFSIGLWDGIKNSLEAIKFKDGYYTLSVAASRWDPMVWVNTALFDEMGVKNPIEYYEEGNWNWDTMRDIQREMLVDSDSDGIPEIYGLGINNDAINSFCYATGKEIVTFNSDGTATNNVRSAELARAVTYYTDLNEKENIYNANDCKEVFAQGKVAMMVGYLWFRSAFPNMIKEDTAMFLPMPRDPQADKYYVAESFGGATLAAKAKNPIGAATLYTADRYDYLNITEDDIYTDEEYLANENMTNKLKDWLNQEFYSEDKYPVIFTWETFELGKYWGEIWFRPRMGEPWATIAEELAPQIDDDIAKIMED